MPSHTIHLRGPWNLVQSPQTTSPETHLPEPPLQPTRIQLPVTFNRNSPASRLQRHFHRPTRLTPLDQVVIVILADGDIQELALNHTLVPLERIEGRWEANVTPHLALRNLLEFDLLSDPLAGNLPPTLHAVRIEIRSTATALDQ